MLRSLSIRDFVIVDRMELEFPSGFTVLTGETGAGKSILVDALALVLGERAEAIVIRENAERAEISAQFEADDQPDAQRWLAENDLTGDGDALLLRRVIDKSSRSRGYVNGRPATLSQLRELGGLLVDIHGQHEHQSLGRAAAQRALLDAYGGLEEAAARVRQRYGVWRQRHENRVAFETNAAAFALEREQLELQVRELNTLNVTGAGWSELTEQHTRLAHAAGLAEAAHFGLEGLSEGESSGLAQLNAVIARLKSAIDFDPKLGEIVDVLESGRIQLQEAVYGLRHYSDRIELDPQQLKQVEDRMSAIHDASRKYRVPPEQLPEKLLAAKARLEELKAEGDAEALRILEEQAFAECVAEAKQLSKGRAKAAKRLSDQVTAAMQDLAMAGGRFEVALERTDDVGANGMENAVFLVAPHKGMAAQPLAKVASGGELSRLSLAIQSVATQFAKVPTLIFDEVDAGIGGRVAEIVGRMLRRLGTRHQVMCITHLPQVAASAEQQWQVTKSTANGKVFSRVTVLQSGQRVEEIARMLGGVKITETTRKHAAEMLKNVDR
jgi:DNA repair protein RecN (Recombination protein N)